MYDRAPRDINFKVGCTPDVIGPGSYDAAALQKSKLRTDGYAPFLSMTSRETFLKVTDQVVAAPGPGHYDTTVQDRAKGASSLANKSKRFADPVSDTPGPGSYSSHAYVELGRKSRSAPGVMGDDGKLIKSTRVKFHRKPEAPSIPTQGQAYGYEECEDGTLKKQDPPVKDMSIGPAYYTPALPESAATKTYKGVHFGKLSSKRMEFYGKSGPGPGDYDPFTDHTAKPENLNIQGGEVMKFEAKLPRYHELVQKEVEKKGVPGPGAYEVKSTFIIPAPALNTEGLEVDHPPFLSQAKRFAPLKSATPAPGSYNDPRTALEVLKRVSGMKRSPFSQTSVRFETDYKKKRSPGPGTYNIPGLAAESMRKAYIESTRKGVFGTTSTRIEPLSKKEDIEVPGPAHYQIKEKPFKPKYPHLGSNFASVTARLKSPELDAPPPGSYDVVDAYEKLYVKPIMAKPRTEAAYRKHHSFMASADRFAPARDTMTKRVDPDNPGPASYNTAKETINPKGGLMVTKDRRFRENIDDFPGPGTYELSPMFQDTVLKGTFNHTLNNPILAVPGSSRPESKHAFLIGV
uniref:Sperm-tail PG-rich repeat-containing protein 2 n=1 Tax=Biomphalaria glabrata TaxID=6526 RepID=A0A2C9KKI0_BIOGL